MTAASCLAAIEALQPPPHLPSPQDYYQCYQPVTDGHSPDGSYSALAPGLRDAEAALRDADPHLVTAYNRFLLAYLVERFYPGLCPLALTSQVEKLFERQMARLAHTCEQADSAHFALDNDIFLKDLAIATGRLVPLGAEFALVNAGIPRRLLLSGGVRQCCRFGAFIIRCKGRLGGFLELHAHPHCLEDFNPEGWTRCLGRLASMLQKNSRVPGAFSSSWFLDPQLAAISPRLGYLREQTIATGARLFRAGPDLKGTSGAIERSPTRRALFERGEYIPQIYTRVWTRNALIRHVTRGSLPAEPY